MKVMPPTTMFIILTLTIISHLFFPLKRIISPHFSYIGPFLIIIGLVFTIWPEQTLKKNQTTVKTFNNPNELVTTGPFKISRNPIYLGMLLMLLGTSITLSSASTFLFPIIFFMIAKKFYISYEEQNLERIFGENYLEYKNQVRRWV